MIDLKLLIEQLFSISALIPGASEEELKVFVERCQQSLQTAPPLEYVNFLRQCNGGAKNGVFLYSTHRAKFEDCADKTNDFIEINLNWRDLDWMSDYLVLGDSDMDIFVYEKPSKNYQIRDRQVFDNIYAEYDSLNELMHYALRLMLQQSEG